MGLDMYAITTKTELTVEVDFHAQEHEQIFYWRKHPNLHGWMEKLYREKGGQQKDFNCTNVALNKDDIDRLEADIKSGSLPHTVGFFFGSSNGSELNDDLEFIAKARQAIQDGDTVFYTSWW